jgi:hypothetical protein
MTASVEMVAARARVGVDVLRAIRIVVEDGADIRLDAVRETVFPPELGAIIRGAITDDAVRRTTDCALRDCSVIIPVARGFIVALRELGVADN